MLDTPREFPAEARRNGWAVGGFNVYNLESARAVAQAAGETRSPVLLQASAGAVAHAGIDAMVAIADLVASEVDVPVALHLDHGKDPDLAQAAVLSGFTSVMIDTSALPFEENIRATREIVQLAREREVHVEAELGRISGIEDLGDVDIEETLTDPQDAARFVEETNVDALAIAIGTAHGAVKFRGEPRLDFGRLQAVAALIDRPLVLHGASAIPREDVEIAERFGAELPSARGIPEEMIRRAIGLGIAKINTDSDLRLAALARMRQVLAEQPGLFNMYQLMGEVQAAIQAATAARMELFGSAGKA